MNDITQYSSNFHFILFADDTNLFSSNKCYEVLIRNVNEELEKLSVWFKSNKLSLNAKKTQYMMFGKRKVPEVKDIILNNEKLTKVEHTKFLGVYIDNKLNWKHHINVTSSKIARNLGIINKLRYKLSFSSLKTLYNILIQPHLFYCTVIWGCAMRTSYKSASAAEFTKASCKTHYFLRIPISLKSHFCQIEDLKDQ